MRNVLVCLLPIVLNEAMRMLHSEEEEAQTWKGRKKGAKTVKRERRAAEKLFRELSDTGFREMYRMSRSSFWKLYEKMPILLRFA
jgi:hypothetical protein